MRALLVFGLTFALAGGLGYWAATQPSGEFGNLAIVFYGVVIFAAAGILALGALILAIWQRRLLRPLQVHSRDLLLAAVAGGLLLGFRSGIEVYNFVCCNDIQPDPVRVVALELDARLAAPFSMVLEGGGECYVDTSSTDLPGLAGVLSRSDPLLEVRLEGLPSSPLDPEYLDAFDVTFYDGVRGWGYRATDPAQVQISVVSRLEGTTRLIDMPLVEEPPAGVSLPPTINAEIDWRCDIDALL
ncbi:hypothetical protein BH23CHL7_BH23CHL7_04820 [soil metagenome]